MKSPMRSFWIWFSPRTGSTLLCKALEQTRLAGKAGEFFNFENETLRSHHAVQDYPNLQKKIWELGSSKNGVMGVKYSLFHASFLPIAQEMIHLQQIEGADPLDWRIWEGLFPNCLHIYLTRRNKIRQAVSWWKAIQDNQWHRQTSDSPAQDAAFYADKYNFDALSHLYKESMLRESATEAYFAHNGIKPLTVVYEDLIRDYVGTLNRLLYAIGVQEEDTKIIAPYYQQTADDLSEKWVLQFREDLQKDWEKQVW